YLVQQTLGAESEVFLYQGSGELIASNLPQQSLSTVPASRPLALDSAQRALIAATPLLTVSNELDWPPTDFAVSGQPYGYAIDTLALVAAMTGLRLDFVNGLSWPELVALFEGGQLDMLQPVFGTAENSARGRLSLPFLRVPYGVITPPGAAPVSHIGQLDGKRVAIPRGWSILPIVRNHYPHIQVVEANSVRDMFAAVRGGRADAGLDTAAILDYTMR